MSINTTESDMVHVSTSPRQQHARDAANSLLGRNNYYGSGYQHARPPGVRTYRRPSWDPTSGRMSTVRRTFCLLTTFDLILTFILWVIYTQLIGEDPKWKAFQDQVYRYDFRYSLFDTVMVAACRFTFLMLAYGLCKIRHWWTIAITTSGTCIYLLVKCFQFQFNDRLLGGKNPLSYVLLIICFVLAWVETWMLDFKVLPHEKKVLDRLASGVPDERAPLLPDEDSLAVSDDNREYYSPFHTPEGSDEEGEIGRPRLSRTHSRKDLDYYSNLVSEAERTLLELLEIEDWKLEAGTSLDVGCVVHSVNMKKYGRKIFRLTGYVEIGARTLWTEMVEQMQDSPKWNPTVLETRTLQIIDDNTDIIYSVAAEGAKGLVSARDFISIRHWKESDGKFLSLATGCKYSDMPPQKKYVRGENGHGGWVLEDVPESPGTSRFIWFVNTNLKGWLPQTLIDQALSGVLTEFYGYLQEHVKDLNNRQ